VQRSSQQGRPPLSFSPGELFLSHGRRQRMVDQKR
jgi:hypothetical protein